MLSSLGASATWLLSLAVEPVSEPPRPDSGSESISSRPVEWRPRSRAVPTDVFGRVTLLGEWGSMPRVGGGNAIAFGLLWPRLRIEITGAYLWPRRFDDARERGGLYQLGSAGARACLRVFAKPTEFPLCIGADAGVLRVDSRGFAPSKTLQELWIAPMLGAGVAVRKKYVGFWSSAELSVTARGSRIWVGTEPVWRTAPVSLRFLVGMEFFIPTR